MTPEKVKESEGEMKRTFLCKCPKCGKVIFGADDWKNGDICIMGECNNCGLWVLEEDADWQQYGVLK